MRGESKRFKRKMEKEENNRNSLIVQKRIKRQVAKRAKNKQNKQKIFQSAFINSGNMFVITRPTIPVNTLQTMPIVAKRVGGRE